jgi:hypothetical protein
MDRSLTGFRRFPSLYSCVIVELEGVFGNPRQRAMHGNADTCDQQTCRKRANARRNKQPAARAYTTTISTLRLPREQPASFSQSSRRQSS